MELSIQNYISARYDVVFLPEGKPVEECSLFLLEEHYSQRATRECNGIFISRFAPPGSIVFMSGETILKKSPSPEVQLKRLLIQTKNVRVIGWDIADYAERGGITRAIISLILMNMQQCPDQLCPMDWHTLIPAMLVSQELLYSWLKTKFDIFQTEGIRVAQALIDQDKCFFEANTGTAHDLTQARTRTLTTIQNEVNCQAFPDRLASMITTLERVRETHFSPEGKYFLIAEHTYLEENHMQARNSKEKAAMSLGRLQTFLSTSRDVAVLRPKCLTTTT